MMNECGVYLQVRHRLWGDQPEDDEAGPLYVHAGGFPPSIPGPRQQLCQAERYCHEPQQGVKYYLMFCVL